MSQALVLCYHAISDSWAAPLAVTSQALERHLRLLRARGFTFRTFTEAILGPQESRTLVVTFDDAFRSTFDLGLPILSRLGIPGTVFVPSAFVGKESPMGWPGIDHWIGGPHEAELLPMSWDQLRSLADAGWEIGSHTRTHPRLTQLDDKSLARELADSRRECEENLDAPCRSLAYPYGDQDERTVLAARAAGYAAACTLPTGWNPPDPLCWPRVGVYRRDGQLRFRLKVSPVVRRLRRAGADPSVRDHRTAPQRISSS